jgi:hypothetical protein
MPLCLGSGRIVKPSYKVKEACSSTPLEKMSTDQRKFYNFWMGTNGRVQVHNRTVAFLDATCPVWYHHLGWNRPMLN